MILGENTLPLICSDCKKEKPEILYWPYEEKPLPRCATCHFAAMSKYGWAKDPAEKEVEERRKAEAFARLKALREKKKKEKEEARNT